MIPGKQYTPEDVVALAWKRKWLILASVTVCAAVAFAIAHVLPERYQSETTIMVVPQRVPETYVRSTVSSGIEDRLKSISQEILSRIRLERIVKEFDLYRELRARRSMDEVIARMRSDIDVRLMGGDTFRVAYTSDNPVTAKDVAQRLASMFIDENLRDREVVADDTSAFLQTQLDRARGQLEEQERKLEAFRRQYASELPTQLQANQQMLQNTQLQLQALDDSLNRDRDRRLALDQELSDLTTAMASSDAPAQGPATDVEATARQLETARAALRELSSRYTPQHPDVIRASHDVKALEAKLAAQLATPAATAAATPSMADAARDRRARQLRTELELTDRRIAAKNTDQERLRATMDEIRRHIDATPTRESELTALTRDYQTLSQLYTSLLAKREDSQIAANLEKRQIGEQFKILDPARVPDHRVSPNRRKITGMGGGIGLAIALGIIALLEYRNSGLRSEEEVRACTGLPVVAVIPLMVPLDVVHRPTRMRRLRGALQPPSALPAGPGSR